METRSPANINTSSAYYLGNQRTNYESTDESIWDNDCITKPIQTNPETEEKEEPEKTWFAKALNFVNTTVPNWIFKGTCNLLSIKPPSEDGKANKWDVVEGATTSAIKNASYITAGIAAGKLAMAAGIVTTTGLPVIVAAATGVAIASIVFTAGRFISEAIQFNENKNENTELAQENLKNMGEYGVDILFSLGGCIYGKKGGSMNETCADEAGRITNDLVGSAIDFCDDIFNPFEYKLEKEPTYTINDIQEITEISQNNNFISYNFTCTDNYFSDYTITSNLKTNTSEGIVASSFGFDNKSPLDHNYKDQYNYNLDGNFILKEIDSNGDGATDYCEKYILDENSGAIIKCLDLDNNGTFETKEACNQYDDQLLKKFLLGDELSEI